MNIPRGNSQRFAGRQEGLCTHCVQIHYPLYFCQNREADTVNLYLLSQRQEDCNLPTLYAIFLELKKKKLNILVGLKLTFLLSL